jgi:competence protein ComEC
MPKSYYTIGMLLSFLGTTAALLWHQQDTYPLELWIILGLLGCLSLFVAVMGRLGAPMRSSFGMFLFCIVIGSSLAFLRVSHTTHVSRLDSVETYATERWVQLHGVIKEEPDRRPMKTKYTVEVDEFIFDEEAAPLQVHGKILVTDHSAWPSHSYGDEVLVSGTLEKPGQIEDFHYDRFLSRYGVYSVMYRARVETVSSGHGSALFAFLYEMKKRFESQINRLYPEPHASFMAGLLTGSRKGIPEHLLADFQTTGLTHIIAISGYNISIVIAIISSFLFFLPLKWRFLPSVLAIIFFTFFVGASPSVVRAAIMGGLGLFALQVGRQNHSFIAILLTGACMVAWNPKFLWYDAGFQLSFLSVLGLSYLAPFLERLFSAVPHTLGLRESLQMTIAAQLMAVPLIVVLFGHFSLIAPVANIFVAPFIPLAMLFGFLGTMISFASFPLGLFIAYLGWGCLQLIILLTQFFATVPYALLETGDIGVSIVWAYYVLLLFGVCLHSFWSRSNNGITE